MKFLTASSIQSKTNFTYSQKNIAAAIAEELTAQGYRVISKTWDEKGNLSVDTVKDEKLPTATVRETPKVKAKIL